MIRRYLCLPILLATASWFLTPTRAQQGSLPQHAPSQRALRTSDSASRGAVAGGTPSVPEVEVNRVRISNTDDCAQMTIELGGRAQYQAGRLSDPDRIYIEASGVVNVWSGLPYNITTGKDDNGDTVFNDRPLGLWRNAGRGAGFTDVDLRVSKRWRVFLHQEHAHFVELAWDAFNIFNHVNYQNYNGVIISPTFGQPHTAYPARQLQVSVRYHF